MNKSEIEEMILQCEQNAIPDSEIDYSDIPPVRDFSGFELKTKNILNLDVNKFPLD